MTELDTPSDRSSAPRHGTFKIRLQPDGTIVVPDLAEPLIPFLESTGADPTLWREEPCAVERPILISCRLYNTCITRDQLLHLPSDLLWQLHTLSVSRLAEAAGPPATTSDQASLLDLKMELAHRLLSPCVLCERRCSVSRANGETGFCGLGTGVQVAAYSMLYNEGPLVGAPTFSVFVRGCSLRCTFCYRPDELKAKGRVEMSAVELASILDHAADNGAQSWHFLGGNPDESLPAILQALSLAKRSLPLVWNSALMLIPEALELLKGVVDIWLPDFKFGNDACAQRIAQIDDYGRVITRNLLALRGQPWVVVRHMTMPDHAACCTEVVKAFVREQLPAFRFHAFPCFSLGSSASAANTHPS